MCGVFTRRDPKQIDAEGLEVHHIDDIENYTDKIDVLVLCSGSATDLPLQGPEMAKMFNVVDSFDTHAKIPEYYEKMNNASNEGRKVSVISTGWDPGMFSINRLYGEAILPKGKVYTFLGPGVSQGHSQAIKEVKGVLNAIQYTIPVEEAMAVVLAGQTPDYTTREKHTRHCYIVAAEDADKTAIEQEIRNMPNYFLDYDTTVNFISIEEFNKNHRKMPHGGFVITSGNTTKENKQVMEFSLKLENNPEFTASIMLAYARAAYRLYKKGEIGAKTVFDIPPAMISTKTAEELRREIL